MYATNPCGGTCAESDGLGLWAALIPIGAKLVGGLFDGDGDRMSVEQYYPAVKAGTLLCAGPYDIGEVASAIDHLDASPEGSRLTQRITTLLSSDVAWRADRYGMPVTGRERAGALVNWAHGGRDCTPEPNELAIRPLLDDILRAEAERRSLLARAQAAAAQAQTFAAQVGELPEIVPGVSTPLLAVGALGLAALFFRRTA